MATPQWRPAQQRIRHKVALNQARSIAQDLGSLSKRLARTPQSVIRGGWDRPPHKRLIIQGQKVGAASQHWP